MRIDDGEREAAILVIDECKAFDKRERASATRQLDAVDARELKLTASLPRLAATAFAATVSLPLPLCCT